MTGWPPEMQAAFLAQQAAAQHSHYSIHFADAEWLIIEREAGDRPALPARDARTLHIVDISLLPDSRGQGSAGHPRDILDQARDCGRA
jgi:hypothetical protein